VHDEGRRVAAEEDGEQRSVARRREEVSARRDGQHERVVRRRTDAERTAVRARARETAEHARGRG
jgi:hypothetical protein